MRGIQHFPLSKAHLCVDCNAVCDSSSWCPACSSCALIPLAKVLDRATQPEIPQTEGESAVK